MTPIEHARRVRTTHHFLHYAAGYLHRLVTQIESVLSDERQLGYRSIDVPTLVDLDGQLALLVEKIATHLVGDGSAPPDGARLVTAPPSPPRSTGNRDPYDLAAETPPDPELDRPGLTELAPLGRQRPTNARISQAHALLADMVAWHDQLLTVLTPLATDAEAAFQLRDVQQARTQLAAGQRQLADYLVRDHELAPEGLAP